MRVLEVIKYISKYTSAVKQLKTHWPVSGSSSAEFLRAGEDWRRVKERFARGIDTNNEPLLSGKWTLVTLTL